MPGPKTSPRTPSTEEEWSSPYESESDTEGSCLLTTEAEADAKNEAHETLRELTQLMRKLTVGVEEMKAAIKNISDNVYECSRDKRMPPARSKKTKNLAQSKLISLEA